MDAEYWLQRWRDGRIGWHHEKVMPLLVKHRPTLGVARRTRVLAVTACANATGNGPWGDLFVNGSAIPPDDVRCKSSGGC